jgi:hypothetical protein
VEVIAVRPPNDPLGIPNIAVPPNFCCIIIAAHPPCTGGGPPGESSACDYSNFAYAGAGADENGNLQTTSGRVNICKCRLRPKMCANQPDSDLDFCNYKLDCGDKGSFDVSNGHLAAVRASIARCRGGDRPCETIVSETTGPLGIAIVEYSCEALCECLAATSELGRSCIDKCYEGCHGLGTEEEIVESLAAWLGCVGIAGGTTAGCEAICRRVFKEDPVMTKFCTEACKRLVERLL